MRKSILTGALAVVASGMLAFGGMAMVSVASAETRGLDLDGTYHARMGIQTSNIRWIMQMNYYKGEANETLGTELENKLFCADPDNEDKLISKNGTFNEVEIAGNGVYTVTLDKADFDGETDISQLHVATDIPLNDKIKFSNVKVKINGTEFVTFDEAVMEDEAPYLEGGMVVLVLNHWRESVVSYMTEHGRTESAANGWTLLSGQGDENISITFTVSGFNKDNPEAVEVTPAPMADKAGGQSIDISEGEDSLPVTTIVVVVVIVIALVTAGVVILVRKSRKRE